MGEKREDRILKQKGKTSKWEDGRRPGWQQMLFNSTGELTMSNNQQKHCCYSVFIDEGLIISSQLSFCFSATVTPASLLIVCHSNDLSITLSTKWNRLGYSLIHSLHDGWTDCNGIGEIELVEGRLSALRHVSHRKELATQHKTRHHF